MSKTPSSAYLSEKTILKSSDSKSAKGETSFTNIPTRKTDPGMKVTANRVSKGSEDPIQVYNKHSSLDKSYEMEVEGGQTPTSTKGKKDFKPILPP
jgi:hypothetical protein